MDPVFIIADRQDYPLLSNFARLVTPITYQDVTSHTVEALFQAAKSEDLEEAQRIASLPPADAKRAGRAVTLVPFWNECKIHVMHVLLAKKFAQTAPRRELLSTGDAVIFEDSPWDSFWGTGARRATGPGLNHMGRLLMQTRANIRNGWYA